ncbi:MAG: ribosome assembly factor SBDS [Candidatus Nezhaarchaeota archaeon]|nr:ribosome assembly factor SBDS [Candidatus Nezhaarchaeota archaeon]MCX8141928.1 ribosome assembly factor SBDS [Candidatus Nezhaarchaeota archaeon]
MSGESEHSIARLVVGAERFEVLVNPEKAWQLKQGVKIDIKEVMINDVVYKDAKKGLRASKEVLQKFFKTIDPYEVGKSIVLRGEIQLTARQRKEMIESKRKQIITFISRNCVDAKTGLPLPPTRVELLLNETRISIDPFRDAEEQALEVIKLLRAKAPIKLSKVLLEIKASPQYASKVYSLVPRYGDILKSQWLSDGSWKGEVEVPAGLQLEFIDKLNKMTHGDIEVKIVSKS